MILDSIDNLRFVWQPPLGQWGTSRRNAGTPFFVVRSFFVIIFAVSFLRLFVVRTLSAITTNSCSLTNNFRSRNCYSENYCQSLRQLMPTTTVATTIATKTATTTIATTTIVGRLTTFFPSPASDRAIALVLKSVLGSSRE